MSDLIDRQAAIDILASGDALLSRALDDMDVVGVERDKFEWGLGLIDSYIEDFKELPSVNQWIPCSDRLPEVGDKVLVSTKNTVFAEVFKGTHESVDSWWWTNNTIKIIYAWMPLPTAFKGEEE